MALLNREQILSADDLPRETVKVPEWGGEVIVRTMTGAERDQWEIQVVTSGKKQAPENIRAMIASITICDESGARLFTHDDIKALGGKSAAALDRVMEVALRLNKINQADVEELEKN